MSSQHSSKQTSKSPVLNQSKKQKHTTPHQSYRSRLHIRGVLDRRPSTVSTQSNPRRAMMPLENQLVLMDAASTAGVKRFISSDYGFCTTNPKLEAVPIYAPISKIRQSVRKWRMGKLTWTVRACGAFLDFLFGGPRCWILPTTKRICTTRVTIGSALLPCRISGRLCGDLDEL